ncbi:MAG: DUF3352 domain-containing protein, partial [Candidatus Eremiobacterota bacterium]
MLVLLVLVVLAALGYFLYLRMGTTEGLGAGVLGLARVAPADTRVFLAVDQRRSGSFGKLVEDAKKLAGEDVVSRQLDKLKETLGVSLEEVTGSVSPAAVAVLLPLEGQSGLLPPPGADKPFEAVLAVALSDPERARAALTTILQKQKVETTQTREKGATLNVAGQGAEEWAWTIHRKVLFVATGKSALARVLSAQDGSAPDLSESASFQDALKKIPVGDSGACGFCFVDTRGTLHGWEQRVPPGVTDEATVAAVRAMEYFAGGFWAEGGQTRSGGFLKLDPKADSALVKALLTAPQAQNTTAGFVPVEWSTYSSVNVVYAYRALMGLLMALPQARQQAGSLNEQVQMMLGFHLEKDLLDTLTGDLGMSSDMIQVMPRIMDQNFTRARAQGQYTACKSNLRNIGTALEMYSTDYSGRYPSDMGHLTPNYLKRIPDCPAAGKDTYSASYEVAATPDAYTLCCKGLSHKALGIPEDYPVYTSWAGLDAPYGGSAEAPDLQPTTLILLGLKDPERFSGTLTGLVEKSGVQPETVGKIGDVELMQFPAAAGVPALWARASKPSPVFLLAVGPGA